MPSIRKTKKRLKRGIAELYAEFEYVDSTEHTAIGKVHLCAAIYLNIQAIKQELKNLKRKREKTKKIFTQSDFVKDYAPMTHDVMPPMAPMVPIPFAELGVKPLAEYVENLKRKKQ